MAKHPARNPDYPTCAQCLEMGVYVSPMLALIERDVGHAALIDFLLRWGGQEVSIAKKLTGEDTLHADVFDWLHSDLGYGRWAVPRGLVGDRTVTRWHMLRRLRAGQSLAQVARAVGCTTRAVSQRKTDFMRRGLLPAPVKTLTKETDR